MESIKHKVSLRILIIEDTQKRQEILKQLYKDHAWVLVHTAKRAIKLVQVYQFDVISLDYNLAGEETGDEIARQICHGLNKLTRIIVHSMNPKGRERICESLPHASILPVASMIKTNKQFKQLREALNQGPNFDWSFTVKNN